MFISFDNGEHWQQFQLNLPNVPVSDIKVHRNDLILSTQGRALWILDNVTSLHQLSSQSSTSEVHLFKPRDGYRTRVAPNNLGPVIEYYLPQAPAGSVIIEVLDSKGVLVNSYNSEAPQLGAPRSTRGAGMPGVGGAGPESQPEDPDAPTSRRFGGPPPRPGKQIGINRFVWDLRHQAGVTLPPGQYQARLKTDNKVFTEIFNVLIDPRVAEDGVTVADLQEQFEHNLRMREMVTSVNQLIARVREAQNKQNPSVDSNRLSAVATRLLTEPVRYGRPGLQAHITYLAGMTANVDQKIGRDAIERYEVLKKELEAIKAEVEQLLGPATN